MKQLTKAEFESEVYKVFGRGAASFFIEDKGSFQFEVDCYEVTYDKLTELSTALQTTKISMKPTYSTGGCPTCGADTVTEITVYKD